LNDTISYEGLAIAARVPKQRLKSILRMAMTTGLFREKPNGPQPRVGHSATSSLLSRNEDAYAYATYMCAKSAPTAMSMTEAHRRWGPASIRTFETAYNVAFDTDLPFFGHVSRDKERTAMFARYMQSVRSSDAVSLKHLAAGFAWQDVRDGGVVVDVSRRRFYSLHRNVGRGKEILMC
jgi:6-hydroxytryprostatin B O-methyltransferase